MMVKYYEQTSDNIEAVNFAYHNFGDRGSSSVESASIGGLAHLTQFNGTDIFNSLNFSQQFYNGIYTGFSIPASEHSTVTSWGKDNEFQMIENYLEEYKKSPMIACVLDSYDIYKATNFVTSNIMKEKIESKDYPIFVIRPDSGDPLEVIDGILHVIEKNSVQYSINNKGYKVFNKYRIIWGDGINMQQIDNILKKFCCEEYKLSAENFAFGSGSDLMQNVNRDTCGFAFKCSAIKINNKWHDVYKDPITGSGKKSIAGRIVNDKFINIY